MPINFPCKPGIVAYLTAGDPSLAATRDIALAALDNGADVIELGVPFSDPLADGPVIQRASERAVAKGTRLSDVLTLAKELRAARPAAGIVLFSYLNPVVRMGLATFCARAAEAGADGVLLTDMIVEEAGEYLAQMREHALAPIFLAAPTSPDVRLKAIADASLATGKTGFVYAISRVGITGTQDAVASDAPSLVERLRRFTALPIAVGFGISNAAHVRAVGGVCRCGDYRERTRRAYRADRARAGGRGGGQLYQRAPAMTPGPVMMVIAILFKSEARAWT